jgi:hypothetical protein
MMRYDPPLLQLRTRALPGAEAQRAIMNIQKTILATALALTFFSAAHADGLRPQQAQSIDLGELSGVAYYTVERNGFRVVATLAQGDTGTPVRFEAVLASGQSVVLSTPRAVGIPADAVEISRTNDTMSVHRAATLAMN